MRRTTAQRRREPVTTDPGFLRRARVQPRTLARYMNAFSFFEKDTGTTLNQFSCATVGLLDKYIESYLELLFKLQQPRSMGLFFLAALGHRFAVSFEKTPGAIPFSRVAMAGWRRLDPDVSKEPLPWVLACLMALWLCQQNNAADLQAARGLVVQFDLYLRPCELIFAAVRSCLGYPVKVSRNAVGVIVAPSTTASDERAGRHRHYQGRQPRRYRPLRLGLPHQH